MEGNTFCYNRCMDKSVLSEIIAAEKEVQHCIDQEEMRLREWLEQVKREAAEEVAREEQNDGRALRDAVASARENAGKRAMAIGEEGRARAARMDRCDDVALTRILLERLPRIFQE